jgi:hypothetical protein
MARGIASTSGLSISAAPPDLDNLPLEIKSSGRVLGIFMMLFASLWGGMPAYFILSEWEQIGEEGFIALLFPIVGAGLFLFGVHSLFSRRTVTVDERGVRMERRGLFRRTGWQAPLSSYRGVLTKTVRIRRNKSTVTAHGVFLAHREDEKSVPLYVARDEAEARRQWERAAKRFRLPALEEDASGRETVRELADLDKSVRELAAEGKLDVDFEARPPPASLSARYQGDTLTVVTTGPTVPTNVALILAAAPLVLVAFFAFVGLIVELAVLGWLAWDYFGRERLLIGRDGVATQWFCKWGAGELKRIDASRIEVVSVSRGSVRAALTIVSDDLVLRFGGGQPAEALEWAREAVLAHVAAPNAQLS